MAHAAQSSSATGSPPPADIVTIRRYSHAPRLPRAAPDHPRGALRPWINDALNSRLATPLPAGRWALAWQAELGPGLEPAWVLANERAVVVQGAAVWQLLSPDGKPLELGNSSECDVVLDAGGPQFYTTAFTGDLVGLGSDDGKPAFMLGVLFGSDYRRTYLARVGRRIVLASAELPRDPHDEIPADEGYIELHKLPEPLDLDADGYIEAPTRVAQLNYDTVNLHTAISGGSVVVATPGQVQVVGLGDLRVLRTLRGDFEPRAMSLDETGRAYLLVSTGGKPALWILTPEGELVTACELPPPLDQAAHPPIVGYDHRVYLFSAAHVGAISPDGTLIWIRPALRRFGGATITADDRLLAADGGEIVAFGPAGERVTVHQFEDVQLTTAPILTSGGRLLVAGHDGLYCLEPAGR